VGFVSAAPEPMTAAASDLTKIGSMISEANSAAAGPTTGLLAAGADEVSTAIAAVFGSHAEEFQALSAKAVAFHDQFVQNLTRSAATYVEAEAANVPPLQMAANPAASSDPARYRLPVGSGKIIFDAAKRLFNSAKRLKSNEDKFRKLEQTQAQKKLSEEEERARRKEIDTIVKYRYPGWQRYKDFFGRTVYNEV